MKSAVFTITHNERFMFPIWLRYYSRHFDSKDIFVLDHDTTDKSTSVPGFKINKIHNPKGFDHAWMKSEVQKYQRELLKDYDVVLFTEVDEIVAPLPDKYGGGLRQYIDELKSDYVRCNGWEIFHEWHNEPEIDLSRNIMEQRKWWFFKLGCCKTLLSKVPMNWQIGFHDVAKPIKTMPVSKDLYMIHLHRFDFETTFKRKQDRLKKARTPKDNQLGKHNIIKTKEEHEKRFDKERPVIIKIPDRFASLEI